MPEASPHSSHFPTSLLHVHVPTSLYFQVSMNLSIGNISYEWNPITCSLFLFFKMTRPEEKPLHFRSQTAGSTTPPPEYRSISCLFSQSQPLRGLTGGGSAWLGVMKHFKPWSSFSIPYIPSSPPPSSTEVCRIPLMTASHYWLIVSPLGDEFLQLRPSGGAFW